MAVISEDLLMELYWNNELTLSEIGQELGGYGGGTVLHWMKKFGVPRRSRSDAISGKRNHNYGKPRSKETRRKIGESNRGDKIEVKEEVLRRLYLDEKLFPREIGERFGCSKTTITRRLIKYGIPVRSLSEALKGDKSYWYGKKFSDAMKRRMSKARKGKKPPEEALRKMRAYQRSEKSRKHLSKLNSGENHPQYGTHQSEEHRRKIGEAQMGEKNHAWMGGVSFEPYSPEFNVVLKRRIRERDNYTCQISSCGKYGKSVHHIDYQKENNNKKNLITLCKAHHSKTNFNRERWIECFRKLSSGEHN